MSHPCAKRHMGSHSVQYQNVKKQQQKEQEGLHV